MAIAVADLDAAVAWYRTMFGATVAHRERIADDGVEEALIQVAGSYIQLLTPTAADSPVARFLERHGEGLHHVGYRVADVASALARLHSEGRGRLIDAIPRAGVRGVRRWRSSTPRRPSAPSSSWSRRAAVGR